MKVDSPETKERLKRLWEISHIAASAYHLINEGLEYAVDVGDGNQKTVIPTLRSCQEEARRFIQEIDEFIKELP
jgi:hypothetical protein